MERQAAWRPDLLHLSRRMRSAPRRHLRRRRQDPACTPDQRRRPLRDHRRVRGRTHDSTACGGPACYGLTQGWTPRARSSWMPTFRVPLPASRSATAELQVARHRAHARPLSRRSPQARCASAQRVRDPADGRQALRWGCSARHRPPGSHVIACGPESRSRVDREGVFAVLERDQRRRWRWPPDALPMLCGDRPSAVGQAADRSRTEATNSVVAGARTKSTASRTT